MDEETFWEWQRATVYNRAKATDICAKHELFVEDTEASEYLAFHMLFAERDEIPGDELFEWLGY